ncbi:MAG: acetyl-CoA carboxylase biotin carboxyl carrier protein subunit [Opitutales bacterium]|nr:acetyl-CoA carboxylase biotin carboxyl carrier protein subunit [Opitutales bacterium]
MKKLKVTVDGKTYEVVVEMAGETAPAAHAAPAPVAPAPTPAPVAAPAPAPAPAPAAPAGNGTPIVASMAGKVVSVDVTVGQTVAVDDQVVTFEAMKMKQNVYSTVAGKVTAILVNPGDAIEEGQPLVTIA